MSRGAASRRFDGNFICDQLNVSGRRLRQRGDLRFGELKISNAPQNDGLQRYKSRIVWRHARRCLDFHESALEGFDQLF